MVVRQADGSQGGRAKAASHRSRSVGAPALAQLTAGVALATATTLTATQVAMPTPPNAEVRQVRAVSEDVSLAASSIANIPLNLLIDIINIPHSELQAFDLFAQAQLWGGSWLVTGPSNIWGTDPADAVRFMAAAALLFPFPALSGLDLNAPLDSEHPLGVLAGNGLAQQFWRFVAAEFPVDDNCDAEGCVPTTPTAPITGITGIDRLIWNAMMFTGMVDFPLLSGFFKVGLSQLVNGNFSLIEAPSGKINIVPGFNLPGTIDGPNGENYLPWAGTPINLDLGAPFSNWLDHLMADPADNPIKLPSLEQLGRTVQTLIAGIVVGFDPYTPGSPLCWGYCPYVPPEHDYPTIVKWIGSLWPGNEQIDSWLEAYENGTANTPIGDSVAGNINLFRLAEAYWDFSNAPLDPKFVNIGFNPSDLAPMFHNMWKFLGYDPDPLYPDGDTSTGVLTPVGVQGGVYALKGIQLAPFPFIMESDRWIEDKASTYVGDLTDLDTTHVNNVPWWEPSDQVGKWTLTNAIGDDASPTIFGYSRGAFIAGEWKKDFNEYFNEAEGARDVKPSFVLSGNPLRPNGGSSVRIDWFTTDTRATPTETAGAAPGQITTRDIAYQYDFFADTPTNMLNPIAMTNWAFGIVNHLFYPDDPGAKAVFQDEYGDTDYYLIPSETVPLLYPVKWIPGIGPGLADILDPVVRVLVETGYNRNISPGQPTGTNLLYFPDPAELAKNLSIAIATGLDNGFEQMGLGRMLGTTRPDVTGQGAYGIGGPPVTMEQAEGSEDAASRSVNASLRLSGLRNDDSDVDGEADGGDEVVGEDVVDGEADGGEVVDGEAVDGEVVDGGEAVDGEADGGEVVDGGEAVDGEADGGEVVDGEADGGEVVDGEADDDKAVDGEADDDKAVDGEADDDKVVDGSDDSGQHAEAGDVEAPEKTGGGRHARVGGPEGTVSGGRHARAGDAEGTVSAGGGKHARSGDAEGTVSAGGGKHARGGDDAGESGNADREKKAA
ncbi:PE-PPE domain-containing protein [Mycolicibacterium mengxianglii]|uniref:PE-PPE domain-containing protein n=1 Tax=Mycolicibacterium mengxianglii TaxID=2736649 RepID=UPI0018D14E4D|nr:PE-PPE domain-containing protein [Mycolicibacterium mengxianglii]